MSILQALVLGVVQGVTEFLPVSSSGHLILVPALFGWPEQPVAFDAITNVATLLALLVALRGDVASLAMSVVRPAEKTKRALVAWILVATIPALLVGFFFKDAIETTLRSPMVVVVSLALWGALLWVADKTGKGGVKGEEHVGWKRALAIGCAQAIALIPGTSRSGVTITTGLFAGLDRETAARFSFLLGIPVIAAGSAFALLDFVNGTAVFDPLPMLIGFFAAFLSGLFAIRFLLKILKGGSYVPFAIYRIVLAVVVFVVFLR